MAGVLLEHRERHLRRIRGPLRHLQDVAFIKDLVTVRPLKQIVRSTASVLLIHGDQDETVPFQDSEAYVKALAEAGREVSLHAVPGSNHTFDALPWSEDVMSTTVDWLREKLDA